LYEYLIIILKTCEAEGQNRHLKQQQPLMQVIELAWMILFEKENFFRNSQEDFGNTFTV
jgi:hypothetical protein